ncbi:MAG TPA: LytTR family DNA-binding domain-containing protein [Lachnospiraceae bacterium]|nr:LytTR family DNA-binding domain-containing protein [Lachnospiraceae bacterium]
MEIKVKKIGMEERELVEIYCHEVNDQVKEIVSFVKSRKGQLSGNMDGKQYEIPITDVYYIEAVDNKVFIYCTRQVYETRQKLYELEEVLVKKHFLRVSKSILLNLMKVRALKPALNGRFTAILPNNEEIIISRKYVQEFKKTLKGGNEG